MPAKPLDAQLSLRLGESNKVFRAYTYVLLFALVNPSSSNVRFDVN
jgi:hypothetical protein